MPFPNYITPQFPPDLIPEPQMTIPRFHAYYQFVISHDFIDAWVRKPKVKVGDTVQIVFSPWEKVFHVEIVEDGWGEFDSLREEWDKTKTREMETV